MADLLSSDHEDDPPHSSMQSQVDMTDLLSSDREDDPPHSSTQSQVGMTDLLPGHRRLRPRLQENVGAK